VFQLVTVSEGRIAHIQDYQRREQALNGAGAGSPSG
jgi:hypothetical protein